MELSRRERRMRARRRRRSAVVAASLAATALVLGGLSVAGALPDVAGVGESGASHANEVADTSAPKVPEVESHDSDDQDEAEGASHKVAASSETGTGLANAAGNVTNPVASAVLQVLQDPGVTAASEHGSGRGAAVSDAATAAAQAQ